MLPLPNIEHSLEASREINVQSYDRPHPHNLYLMSILLSAVMSDHIIYFYSTGDIIMHFLQSKSICDKYCIDELLHEHNYFPVIPGTDELFYKQPSTIFQCLQ